jgi:hypothetical protein
MDRFHRRSVLGGTTLAALASATPLAARTDTTAQEQPLQAPLESVSDRVALTALTNPTANQIIYLAEGGRSGFFRCTAGHPPVADDPLQGLIVPSRHAGFYFVREWDGTYGRPEWFGARTNDPDADCADAIEACYDLCPVTSLSNVDYYVRRTVHLHRSWRVLRGVGGNATGRARGSRIILAASAPGAQTIDILVIGPTARPTNGDGMTSDSHFSEFTVVREADCTPHPSGDITRYPAGLRANYLAHCIFRNIASLESSVGFYIGGVVYTKFDDCLSQRVRPGTSSTGDRMVGFYLDGHITFGYSGGNASIYMDRCLAADQHPQHVDATGLLARGAFVDSFLDHFESARIATGMAFHVDGALAMGQTIDLHIRNPVLDGCSRYGIDIDLGLTSSCSIEIFDPYIYSAGGSTGGEKGISIHDGAGLVTLTGGQVHGDFRDGSIHLHRTRGVTLQGVKIHQSVRPIVLWDASGLLVEPQINNYAKLSQSFAVDCRSVSRSTIRPTVVGADGPSFGGGIKLDAASHHVQVDGTAIDPACFATPDASRKIWFGGSDVRTQTSQAAFAAAGNVVVGVQG